MVGISKPLVDGWWITGVTLLLFCVTSPLPEDTPGEKPGILKGGVDAGVVSCGDDVGWGVTGWKLARA